MAIGVQGPGYYHHPSDETQTKTAQRATFTPTLSNQLSSRMLSSSNKYVRGMGQTIQSVRRFDLNQRQKINDSRLARRRSATESSLRNDIALSKAEFKQDRLRMKQGINDAGSHRQMQARIKDANGKMQDYLQDDGYQPSSGLAKVALPRPDAVYLSSPEGHRVRAGYDKPPLLARTIAQTTSLQSDHGVTGVNKALQRTVQYGAVGVRNATLYAKQGIYKAAASFSQRGGEAHTTFQRRADKASDMRTLNVAALRGNVALGNKFAEVDMRRGDAVFGKLTDQGYRQTGKLAGVAPAKTGWAARKASDYFADNEDIMGKRRGLTKMVFGIRNVVPSLKASYHEHKMRIHAPALASADAATRNEAQRTVARHDAKRFKAQYGIDSRKAALQGRLPDVTAKHDPELMDKFGAKEPVVVDDDASSMRSFSSYESSILEPGSEDGFLDDDDQESVRR
ncbi:hypothetical protein [Duganella sp. LjRoot269]|jgi:hypothetical protein|uniref:hypothetical protein n=1 Tax=Duganella sp. LjRoot269 TaxID=3342305 RepID=UPI003ED06F9F